MKATQCLALALSRPGGIHLIHKGLRELPLPSFVASSRKTGGTYQYGSDLTVMPSHPHRKELPREDGISFQDSMDEINTIS